MAYICFILFLLALVIQHTDIQRKCTPEWVRKQRGKYLNNITYIHIRLKLYTGLPAKNGTLFLTKGKTL